MKRVSGAGVLLAAALSGVALVASAGLLTDPNAVITVPNMARPGHLTPVTEPTFGTKVTRVAGNNGTSFSWAGPPSGSGSWGSDVRHHYAKDQPWNADETLLTLQNSGSPSVIFLDGATYQPALAECSAYTRGDDRWHPARSYPNVRINARKTLLEWFDVKSCKQLRSWTLPFPVINFGAGEGNPSNDGRFAALMDATRVFVVDMDPQPPQSPYPNERIGPAYDLSDCGLADCGIDWASVSASGRYVVVTYHGAYVRVLDINPDSLALTPRPTPAGAVICSGDRVRGFIYDVSHADLARNPFDNDDDVIVGTEHCSHYGETIDGKRIGRVMMVRLRDGAITPLTDPTNEPYPHHTSARALDRPGWVYVGYYQDSGRKFNDEIVAVKMDGSGAVERLSHKRSVFSGCYRCESHAVPSRDGRRVLWASNWAEKCGALCGSQSDIKAYVVDVRPLLAADTTPPAAPTGLTIDP